MSQLITIIVISVVILECVWDHRRKVAAERERRLEERRSRNRIRRELKRHD
jgi:hypothetical protein